MQTTWRAAQHQRTPCFRKLKFFCVCTFLSVISVPVRLVGQSTHLSCDSKDDDEEWWKVLSCALGKISLSIFFFQIINKCEEVLGTHTHTKTTTRMHISTHTRARTADASRHTQSSVVVAGSLSSCFVVFHMRSLHRAGIGRYQHTEVCSPSRVHATFSSLCDRCSFRQCKSPSSPMRTCSLYFAAYT